MSVDPRRSGVLCGSNPRCYRECRCSRWPDYRNRFGNLVNAGQEYYEKVLSYSPIAYWPLWETSGTVAECLVNAAMNFTYARDVSVMGTRAGIGDGYTAPTFNGAADYAYAGAGALAALIAVLNGPEGSAMIWTQQAAGTWTDGTRRDALVFLQSAQNYINLRKEVAANSFTWIYVAGNGQAARTNAAENATAWVCRLITWSDANNDDEMVPYSDGVQIAAASNLCNVWGANIIRAIIGATDTVGPANPWSGGLCHAAVWDGVLTLPGIVDLASP